MKMRLCICSICGNISARAWDDENTHMLCGTCEDYTKHDFTDCTLNIISLKDVQNLIDKKGIKEVTQ